MKFFAPFIVIILAGDVAAQKKKPLHKQSFAEIKKNYLFINDFRVKPERRPISDHFFWKYILKIPKITFPIDLEVDEKEMPLTMGDGMGVYHLNQGRALFLEGKTREARNIWLGAKARYGTKFKFHRRVDFFIYLAFLRITKEHMIATGVPLEHPEAKSLKANVATFASWAFILKEDIRDPEVEKHSAKHLRNLAAMYHFHGRYAQAYGAADRGLNYLRKTGKSDHRAALRQILAEAHIRNRTYLDAMKEIDLAIRQDADPKLASALFARAADIYFNLNNYELATEFYATSNQIDRELELVQPAQFVLRGEALFWMGQFDEAQKNFRYAIENVAASGAPLPSEFEEVAQLRIADAYLAQKKYEKAKLEYFKVRHKFNDSIFAKIADVRGACLDLPTFKGNNINHGRAKLAKLKTDPALPIQANELAWACEVSSYAQHERTQNMVTRVAEFYTKYPESRFLNKLIEPVRETQAAKLDELFAQKKDYAAINYFESTRETLFKTIPEPTKRNLFAAYVDVFQSDKAKDFWNAYQSTLDTDLAAIRKAVFLAESAENSERFRSERDKTIKSLEGRKWVIKYSPRIANYINRILQLSSSTKHLKWIYNLSIFWAKTNPEHYCRESIPILSRSYHSSYNPGFVFSETNAVSKSLLPKLLDDDETCAITLLELETKIFANNPKKLGEMYLERQAWKLTKVLVSLFWQVAEINYQAGNEAIANKIWQNIKTNGPPDSAEVRLATLRLDNKKTIYENIWD